MSVGKTYVTYYIGRYVHNTRLMVMLLFLSEVIFWIVFSCSRRMFFLLKYFLFFPLVTHCMRRRLVNFHLGFLCILIAKTMLLIFLINCLAFSLFVIKIFFIIVFASISLSRSRSTSLGTSLRSMGSRTNPSCASMLVIRL